jgi:hypothetical protein
LNEVFVGHFRFGVRIRFVGPVRHCPPLPAESVLVSTQEYSGARGIRNPEAAVKCPRAVSACEPVHVLTSLTGHRHWSYAKTVAHRFQGPYGASSDILQGAATGQRWTTREPIVVELGGHRRTRQAGSWIVQLTIPRLDGRMSLGTTRRFWLSPVPLNASVAYIRYSRHLEVPFERLESKNPLFNNSLTYYSTPGLTSETHTVVIPPPSYPFDTHEL